MYEGRGREYLLIYQNIIPNDCTCRHVNVDKFYVYTVKRIQCM